MAYQLQMVPRGGNSPDITVTWVPSPNVNLPLSTPVFTLQVTPLQKLRPPTYSLDRKKALASQA